jgi:hypothetical protein
MTAVDGFIVPVPIAFGKDPKQWDEAEIIELRAWAEYLHRFLNDMWERSGGGNDDLGSVIDVVGGEDGILGGEFGNQWQQWAK